MGGTPQIVIWAGLMIGLAFGICGQLSGFCLMSGLRGWWVAGQGRQIRAFALALAVALVGSQALEATGLVNLGQSVYMQPVIAIPVVLLGGALFGYGMVMANGCGARAIVLLGNGNLRSFLVLLCLGIAAYMTLTGLFAPWRTAAGAAMGFQPGVNPPTLTALVAGWGLDATLVRWLIVLVMAGGLVAFALASAEFRKAPLIILSAAIIGALIPASWYATGVLGYDDFDPAPLASLTFIAPIGDTIQYAMLATGTALSFGVMVVSGVFIGSLGAALATRRFRLEGFTRPRAMLRYMGGGALMGIGGALAMGCSIGQGLSGLSTLALGSFIAAAGILLGAFAGLRGPLALGAPNP